MILNLNNTSSQIRTQEVLDTEILLLITRLRFYVTDVPTVFEYYDIIKYDISRLQLRYSHQYFVNEALSKYSSSLKLIDDNKYDYVVSNLRYLPSLSILQINDNRIIKNPDFSL